MQQRRPLMRQLEFGDDTDDGSKEDLESGEFDDMADADMEEMREKRRRRLELQRAEDALYEGEWGYSLIKSLRGKTVGRRLRRKLFKFGVFQVLCGIALLVIAIEEVSNFRSNKYMNNTTYGSSVLVSCV
jgi:hypothetical protein